MRKTDFVNDQFYHVYNRGVDHRFVFGDSFDMSRFYQSMEEFNSIEPIGSIYENRFRKTNPLPQLGRATSKLQKLVNIVAYCLNENHYHFILEQLVNGGISEFMKCLGGGYTKYFNNKIKRSGVLFQGQFKSKHIDSNEYLLHLSAYVNLNNRVHTATVSLGHATSKLSKSSWDEYMKNGKEGICAKDIIFKQFNNIREYEKFSLNSLQDIIARKKDLKELDNFLLDDS